jgi:hypothetical protein
MMCLAPDLPDPAMPADQPGRLTLKTTLVPRGPAAAVMLTDEQLEHLGQGAKTPAVRVTVNGGYAFDGRVGRMKGETLVGFNKAVRTAAGVEAGDEIEVELVVDTAPREVEVPEDLAAALAAEPGATEKFDALAYSHRKEFARWVADAKRAETRERRVAEAVQKVLAGQTR